MILQTNLYPMRSQKLITICLTIFVVGARPMFGQNGPNADDYTRQAEDFRKNQKTDSASIYYEKAALEYETLGQYENYINAYNQRGAVLTRADEYKEATISLEKARVKGLELKDQNSLVIANTYISLGVVYAAEEEYEQSLNYHNKALNIRLLKLGELHADVATSYGNIGNVYLRKKEFDKAIDAHFKAMTIRQKLYGESAAETSQSYYHLANSYKEKKDYSSALMYYEKALKNKILLLGESHKDLVKYYKSISDVYYLMGNNDLLGDLYKAKAEELLKKSN